MAREKKNTSDGGFYVHGICLAQLCHSIAEVPGVVFTYRRRFFYWSDVVFAAFKFKGQEFTITPEPREDGWWVRRDQKNTGPLEIQEIEASVSISSQNPWSFWENLGFRKNNK